METSIEHPIGSPEWLEQKKKRFAEEWLRSNDAYLAGTRTFPEDLRNAMRAISEFPIDPFVLAEKERLLKQHGAKAFLPTKEDAARAVWEKAHKEGIKQAEYATLMKLYAEIMSYIEKPAAAAVNVTVPVQKVMVVKDMGSDDAWEKKLQKQQQDLINASRSTKH